jgi:hypothetical protein
VAKQPKKKPKNIQMPNTVQGMNNMMNNIKKAANKKKK